MAVAKYSHKLFFTIKDILIVVIKNNLNTTCLFAATVTNVSIINWIYNLWINIPINNNNSRIKEKNKIELKVLFR